MSDNQIVNIEDATIFHHFKTILNNVNFKLNIGEFVYIIGETGSGKSSLLRTIYSDIPLKMGKIIVDGQDISNIKKNQLPYLRRKIGIIFQDFQLFQDRNAYENIKFVMTSTGWSDEKKIDNRITQLLEKVGLENKKNSYPFELSGGEQQRLVIARAIVNNPKLIIADEPTGNLDKENAFKMMSLFQKLNTEKKLTIIIATHDEDVFNIGRKKYQLVDGSLELVD